MQQIHRAERYLERIRQLYAGVPHRYEHVSYYADDVLSFFIHCHHIVDWLAQELGTKVLRSELNSFINSNIELAICADLCNGGKHGSLLRSRSGGAVKVNKGNWLIITFKRELDRPTTFMATYDIEHRGKTYDALALAERCIELWRDKVREVALRNI